MTETKNLYDSVLDLRDYYVYYLDGPKDKWVKGKERCVEEEFCVALQVVFEDAHLLSVLPSRWRDNQAVVATAVFRAGWTLRFASARLRAKPSLVLLSKGLKDKFGSILELINTNPLSLETLPSKWRRNYTIVTAAILRQGCAWHFVSGRLRHDCALALLAVGHDMSASVYSALPQDLPQTKQVALVAVHRHGSLVAELPSSMHSDPEIMATCSRTFEAMQFATTSLQSDKSFVLKLVEDAIMYGQANLIGPHVQAFVHDNSFLEEILKLTAKRNIVVCRVSNLAGKAVTTSFSLDRINMFMPYKAKCLGLDRLFSTIPISGSFIFDDKVYDFSDWSHWIRMAAYTTTINLNVNEINAIQIVLHD